MKLTPIRTTLFHLIRKLGLNPQSDHSANTKPNRKRPVAHVAEFVKHEGNTAELTPSGRVLGGASVESCGAGFLSAGGPDLLGLGQAVAEVVVDFGGFGFGHHGCCC